MAEFYEVTTPDMDTPHEGTSRPPAFARTLWAMVGAACALAVPYAATEVLANPDNQAALEGFCASGERCDAKALTETISEARVWVPGDLMPFVGLWGTGEGPKLVELAEQVTGENPSAEVMGVDGEPEVPEVAGLVIEAEAPTEEPEQAEPAEPSLIAGADSDEAPSAQVGEEGTEEADETDVGELVPGAHVGEPSAAGTQLADAAKSAPSAKKGKYARIRIPESSWEGLTTFIKAPNGELDYFYRKLAAVALKEPKAKVRISHFGDSAIAADGMPSSARRLLQRTFGDGGHGYALVTATNNWYRRKDITWETKGFRGEVYISNDAKDSRYGFGGTGAIGGMGARASWKTVEAKGDAKAIGQTASEFAVFFHASKNGGTFDIRVDGQVIETVDTASETPEDRKALITVPDGPHTFEVRVTSGRVKLYGVTVEREQGVVFDGLGTIGARDTRWSNYDLANLTWSFESRDPDLALFMYGGNQLQDKTPMPTYEARLTEVVRNWKKGLGERSCMLVSSIDHGERYRGRVRTVPRQVEIMEVQERVALANGCAWFSLYDAMGGEGSIGEWNKAGLAEGDLAHPTAKGAVVLGNLMYKALMKGLHDFVAAH